MAKNDSEQGMRLENSLWHYACQIYSQTGVETALLALQDDHGADINLILQALWLASEGKQWTKACIPNDYEQWMEEQVLPLRQMRRSMKVDWPQQEGFRQQVKKLELMAEQYALGMLFEATGEVLDTADMLTVNLHRLANFLEIKPELMLNLVNVIDSK